MKKEYIFKLITKKEDKEAVLEYLTKERKIAGKTYISSYYSCLVHARTATGREANSGLLKNKNNIGNWPGAFMYMVLIDHIGGIFEVGNKTKGENKFLKALSNFSNLSDDNAKTLYQLRNSLFHSFCLYDFPRNEKLFTPRVFTVHRGNRLIDFPSKDWDGNATIKKENITYISLFKIGELAEKMHKNILESLNNDTLEVRIPKDGDFTVEKILKINTLCY